MILVGEIEHKIMKNENSQDHKVFEIESESGINEISYFRDIREFFEEVDTDVIFGIEKLRTKIGNFFWKLISSIFGYPFLWAAIGLFYSISFHMHHVGFVILFAGLSSLIIFPIKERYQRRRPYEKHITLRPLTTQKDFSFPSGHTYYAIVNAVSLALCYGGLLSFFLALIIGIATGTSRIYLGVHYFSDVLVSLILGILVSLIIKLFFPLIMVLHVLVLFS